MTWTYLFQPRFRNDLRGMDTAVAQRIMAKLDEIKADPLRTMKRLKGSDVFSLRAGDFRIYARADMARRLLDFERAGHRRNIRQRPR